MLLVYQAERARTEDQLEHVNAQLHQQTTELQQTWTQLQQKDTELQTKDIQICQCVDDLEQARIKLQQKSTELNSIQQNLQVLQPFYLLWPLMTILCCTSYLYRGYVLILRTEKLG